MNIEAYFRSLSDECATLKNRVRMLINDRHWPTDGEWKESVLRNMIRRSAPESLTIGRGFVVDHDRCSSQIDVLIYDNSLPVLYREGDLVFIAPSSCRAIIEVKSRLTVAQFREAAIRLADDAEFIRPRGMEMPLFTGLFSYEISTANTAGYLQATKDAANGNPLRIIDHAALGDTALIKYWCSEPRISGREHYNQWHLYDLAQMSFGYFIHNLLAEVSRSSAARRETAWFPSQGKEVHLVEALAFEDPNN